MIYCIVYHINDNLFAYFPIFIIFGRSISCWQDLTNILLANNLRLVQRNSAQRNPQPSTISQKMSEMSYFHDILYSLSQKMTIIYIFSNFHNFWQEHQLLARSHKYSACKQSETCPKKFLLRKIHSHLQILKNVRNVTFSRHIVWFIV